VRSRSIDVALIRQATREVVIVEIWNWFEGVDGALRGLDGKVEAVRARLDHAEPWQIRGLFVVRDTRRNRQLISELRLLFTARFTADSRIWLKALTQPSQALPAGDSLLWSDRAGTVLRPSRLRG
jgi:hypothetical protein